MKRYQGLGRGVLLVASMGAAACGEKTAFREYHCATPAVRGTALTASARTSYTVDDATWDETAVRQVLHVFAFGGHATDAQITAWADLPPETAIGQMLTLDTVNEQVSPPDLSATAMRPESLSMKCMTGLFSVHSSDNPITGEDRPDYALASYDALARTFLLSTRLRGVNPVRQRVGLLETNYHMALSLNSGVSNRQLASFYDGVLADLANQLPYEQVLTNASLSAAVARQYNHRENVFENGRFSGNEDFGREYHQLFFGILGAYDDTYTGMSADLHEIVTIPSTAKALTDMVISPEPRDDQITLGTELHWQGALQILETTNVGNNARERFDALAPTTIAHAESLANLPVLLVRFLADDQLDQGSSDPGIQARVQTVRDLWAGMPQKNLLEFLQKYAISTAFHTPTRVKYWSSIERNILVTNLTTLTNDEAFANRYSTGNWLYDEDVAVFRPSHDVFGGQTGLEASTTADVFRNAYNRSVDAYWSLTDVSDDNGRWFKDWAAVVPLGMGGRHRVGVTAEWLWQRYVADGLAHFGPLERAHLYALLASGTDLGYWIDENASTNVYTLDQVQNSATVRDQIAGAEFAFVNLESTDLDERTEANRRVSLAVNFIVATPWFMAQQGR